MRAGIGQKFRGGMLGIRAASDSPNEGLRMQEQRKEHGEHPSRTSMESQWKGR